MKEEKAKKERRNFTKEFKQEAIRQLEAGEVSAAELARKLGMTREHIYRWRQELKQDGEEAFRGKGNRTADQERIRQLEAEVKRLFFFSWYRVHPEPRRSLSAGPREDSRKCSQSRG